MRRSESRILTTHTGSLIRPPELLDAAAAAKDGDAGAVKAWEVKLEGAVQAVVRRQLGVGLDAVNDGEFGKSSWAAYILERIKGFEIRPSHIKPLDWLGRDRERFADFFAAEMPNALKGAPAEVCVAPIEYTGQAAIARDVGNLKRAMAQSGAGEAFFTTVAPASTAYNGIDEYYSSEEAYLYAIAEALREEYQAIHAAGLLVQVDDAVLANMYDFVNESGPGNYDRWAGLRVDALNHALRDIPVDRVRYHVCYGSWHVPHVADAPLGAIVEHILRVNAGAYSIEAANVRHEHEWEVWESTKLPDGKTLIPGVVTHHTTSVEHPELVAQRLVRFARLVGKENLIAGTDCGFAQAQAVQRVHPSVMWAKLESLVEGARIASRKLWGRD
jgi:5-methyltetrahydropteroyltriglutamate--homocysteine methyltransferase